MSCLSVQFVKSGDPIRCPKQLFIFVTNRSTRQHLNVVALTNLLCRNPVFRIHCACIFSFPANHTLTWSERSPQAALHKRTVHLLLWRQSNPLVILLLLGNLVLKKKKKVDYAVWFDKAIVSIMSEWRDSRVCLNDAAVILLCSTSQRRAFLWNGDMRLSDATVKYISTM